MTTTQQIHKSKGGKRKQKSVFQRVFVPLLLVLVGVGIMLYPVIASTWNNFAQQKVAAEYEEIMKDTDPETLNAAIEAAHEFNRVHTPGPILDPWDARASEDNELYALYLSQLSGQSAMSQVVIPAIDSQLPVYHGTTEKVLQRGLGHLFGSALPVGGEGTHSVITGHTGITNATLWDNLIDVKEGDAIYISTFGERYKYEVHGIDVVLPNETDSLAPRPGEDLITLITCTPYGVNTHRLLVHAHRVPMDPEDEAVFEDTGFKFQWWMWAVLAAALLVLLLMILWITRMIKRAKKNKTEQPNTA
ncbi:class C sortase [Corynebacterium breve]|uniref:Class C sortase n=1 Tax=Corynebacterium breve TaxID=3049799 RepID=A0ABY8VDS5_9CORY|nr:class C sortase [Corynebacterium breve]WIM66895.1 class C sortase [Corynebacterium breve]